MSGCTQYLPDQFDDGTYRFEERTYLIGEDNSPVFLEQGDWNQGRCIFKDGEWQSFVAQGYGEKPVGSAPTKEAALEILWERRTEGYTWDIGL
ncbi:hypothetical protein QTO17_14050 [Vibrio owensii]